jgi:oligopeptide transport system ATP-binding protein
MAELLIVQGLETQFRTKAGVVHAVNGVSFRLKEGETLGLLGESGSGKSASVLSLLGLLPSPAGIVTAGKAMYQGRDILKLSEKEMRSVRGAQISMVSQDLMPIFHPGRALVRQVAEPLETHFDIPRQQSIKRAVEMLELVGVVDASLRLNDSPQHLDAEILQRAQIAAALICTPQILILDDVPSAQDAVIQGQIKRLRDELGMAVIWTGRTLDAVPQTADRVAVMHAGYIVEEASFSQLCAHPQHPIMVEMVNQQDQHPSTSLEKNPLVLFEKPGCCPYLSRCSFSMPRCQTENPPLMAVGPDHFAACWVNTETKSERH